MVYGSRPLSLFTTCIVYLLAIGIVAILAIISRKPQNKYVFSAYPNRQRVPTRSLMARYRFLICRKNLMFLTPGVPLVPVIAIMINIYLILNLSYLTLVRFTLWMIIGTYL